MKIAFSVMLILYEEADSIAANGQGSAVLIFRDSSARTEDE
jgi:hypothetical protein